MKKKKTLKIAGIFLFAVVLILICGVLYLKFFLPDIPVKELKIEITSERIEKGEYLAKHVLVCIDCHSERDWFKYSGPIVPGTEGAGGELFDQELGLPGKYYAANITPYTLGSWSDGEIYRAITSGVGKNNNALFPIMPYWAYGTLDNEDIFSIIAYLRSMPSLKSEIPASSSDFPVNLFINTMPREGQSGVRPPKEDSIAYGEYLTRAAGCIGCHTPATSKGELILEKAYTGGREFPMKQFGVSVSTNITSDKNSGIGNWSKERFIGAFKFYDLELNAAIGVDSGDFNTPMPWTVYSKMDTTDLGAIYVYLQSLPPNE